VRALSRTRERSSAAAAAAASACTSGAKRKAPRNAPAGYLGGATAGAAARGRPRLPERRTQRPAYGASDPRRVSSPRRCSVFCGRGARAQLTQGPCAARVRPRACERLPRHAPATADEYRPTSRCHDASASARVASVSQFILSYDARATPPPLPGRGGEHPPASRTCLAFAVAPCQRGVPSALAPHAPSSRGACVAAAAAPATRG